MTTQVAEQLANIANVPDNADTDTRVRVLQEATPLLSELRGINRAAHETLAERRTHVAASRHALDMATLAYESLEYEHRQLQEQIAAHLAVDRLDHKVLTPADQAHIASLSEAEQHSAELARLQAILDERRQLELEAKQLGEEVNKLQKQSRLSHRTLVRLEQNMASLHQSVQKHAT